MRSCCSARRFFGGFSRTAALILNDRVPLVVSAGYDGVHVGQEDLSPAEARATLGSELMVGVSTHGEIQLVARRG